MTRPATLDELKTARRVLRSVFLLSGPGEVYHALPTARGQQSSDTFNVIVDARYMLGVAVLEIFGRAEFTKMIEEEQQ